MTGMLRVLTSAVLCSALLLAPAVAQTGGAEPTIGSAATDAQAQPADAADTADAQASAYHILAVGDALGGGLGAGLLRAVEGDAAYDVTLRFNELSGIARPELYDWSTTLPQIVQGKDYNAIVILIGENDRQDIHNDSGTLGFGTDAWKAAYVAQLDKVTAALKATGSAVYWVSLPPMAKSDYDAAMQQVAGLQKQRVEAAGLHYVDIRKDFLDADGNYADRGPDEQGTVIMWRGRDGVSFYKTGNNRLGQLVLAAIKAGESAKPVADVGQTEAASKVALPQVASLAPANAVPTAPAPAQAPLFGSMSSDGADQTFRPEITIATVAGSASAVPLSVVQEMAPAGSAAQELLVKGLTATPPAGRADDFSLHKQ